MASFQTPFVASPLDAVKSKSESLIPGTKKGKFKHQESDQLVEVFIDGKRVLCEAATAEEVLAHSLGSEEATTGKLLAVKSSGEILAPWEPVLSKGNSFKVVLNNKYQKLLKQGPGDSHDKVALKTKNKHGSASTSAHSSLSGKRSHTKTPAPITPADPSRRGHDGKTTPVLITPADPSRRGHGGKTTPVPITPADPSRRGHGGKTDKMDVLISKVEEIQSDLIRIKKSLKTLTQRQKLHEMKSFTIDKSEYEEELWSKVAKAFALSMPRLLTDKKCSAIVEEVLGKDPPQHQFIAAVQWCNKKFSTFRAEERRKILGSDRGPYASYNTYKTEILAQKILRTMKAPMSHKIEKAYTKNLAILRKFVRETPGSDQPYKMHEPFRKWIKEKNPNLTDEVWAAILEEDREVYKNEPAQEDDGELPGGGFMPPTSSSSEEESSSGDEQ